MMERRGPLARRGSQQDDLEESRKRHDMFRSSIFSSIKGGLVPEITHGLSGELEGVNESRIDAAIRAAMAQDAQRGQIGFQNRYTMTPTISSNSSFPNNSGHNSHASSQVPPKAPGLGTSNGEPLTSNPRDIYGRMDFTMGPGAQPPAHQQLPNVPPSELSVSGTGSSVDPESTMQSGGGPNPTTELDYYKDDPQKKVPSSSATTVVYGGGRIGNSVSSDQVGGTPGGGGNGSKGNGWNGAGERSTWVRGGGTDTVRVFSRAYPSVGDNGTGPETPGANSVVGRQSGARKDPQSAIDATYADEDPDPVQDAELGTESRRKSYDVPPIDDRRSDNEVDSTGVALTPSSEDEPLELPNSSQHISLAKFLQVMTGPGLRVRKHHRAGKGSSGLRVLRYSEEEDSLVWDSHKILGAAQHVLPLSDVEEISRQSGNRVVLTCVGGKDSYAVFEAAKDDAAAVLFVGLERLRERSAARSS